MLVNARQTGSRSSFHFEQHFAFCIPDKSVGKQMNINIYCHDNGFLLLSSFCITLLVLNAIFKLVCLNNLIVNCLCLGTCEFYMLRC